MYNILKSNTVSFSCTDLSIITAYYNVQVYVCV